MKQTAKQTNDTPAPPRARREKRGSHTEKKIEAWLQQHGALQAPAYRLTLIHPEKKSFNVGKKKDGSEQYFSADEVVDRLRLLAAKNSQGYNVYVTPINDLEHYIVLDDTTTVDLDALKGYGFKPCLIQESSPGNLQGIFRVERQTDFEKEQSAANAVVCRLNMKFGDPGFSGVVHPFRLAGFANRKDKYAKNGRYPFVTIHEARAVACCKLGAAIEQEREKLRSEQPKPDRIKSPKAKSPRTNVAESGLDFVFNSESGQDSKSGLDQELVRKFHSLFGEVSSTIEQRGLRLDYSRIDFQVAKKMLFEGIPAAVVIRTIVQASPGVSERHRDVGDYARRTVANAGRCLP